MIFTKSNGIMTAAIMLSLSATVSTFAQQIPEPPGIVRISARPIGSGAQSPAGQPIEQTSAFGHHFGHTGRTIYVDGSVPTNAAYPAGACPTGNCPTGNGSRIGNGYGNSGDYQSGGSCPTGQCPHCRGGRCHFCEYYCKHSPGYGYAPPSKYPLQRRGVEYTHYYPAQWYGAGADYSHSTAPMVYQPTDTTQLGFYYQHVPFWQPQPNQLPERPIPAQWNIKAPAYSASNWNCGYPCYGYGGYRGHHFHNHGMRRYSNGYDGMGSCPVDGSMNYQSPTPQVTNPGVTAPPAQAVPAPVTPEALPMTPDSTEEGSEPNTLPPTTSVPPSPNGAPLPTTSATSGHIRRISFQY